MWGRILPLISHLLSLISFGFFCYAFATPQWFQGTSPRFSGEVTIGLWYVCQESTLESDAILDETLLLWESWICQAWSFPPTSLEIVQGVASIVLLTCFLANICFIPHSHRSIVILFCDSTRTYTTLDERDHSHQLAYGAASLLLFASVGGIACLSMFVNFARYYLSSKSSQYGTCIIFWCVAWIMALFSAIVGAHSIDDFEEYGEFTREEIRQRYINEHLINFAGIEDYEWWATGAPMDEDEERGGEEEERGEEQQEEGDGEGDRGGEEEEEREEEEEEREKEEEEEQEEEKRGFFGWW